MSTRQRIYDIEGIYWTFTPVNQYFKLFRREIKLSTTWFVCNLFPLSIQHYHHKWIALQKWYISLEATMTRRPLQKALHYSRYYSHSQKPICHMINLFVRPFFKKMKVVKLYCKYYTTPPRSISGHQTNNTFAYKWHK